MTLQGGLFAKYLVAFAASFLLDLKKALIMTKNFINV